MLSILIIGSGAVGIGIGAGLISSGCDVTFLAKGETKTALEEKGCGRTGVFRDIYAAPDAFSVTDTYHIKKSFDYVLVTSKAFSNEEIAASLSKFPSLFKKEGKILIIQNGLGTNTAFEKYFDKSLIYNARIITGFSRPERNISRISVHRDAMLMGSMYSFSEECLKPLASAISLSGLPAQTCDDIVKPIWSKVIYNCALNPLSAVFGKPYGFLGEQDCTKEFICHIIDEAYAVMYAAGGRTFIPTAEEYKEEFFRETLPISAAHCASTLQDIQKKQKTEIDTLNGALVSLGERFGVPTPYNNAITLIIRGIEAAY